MLVPVLMPCRCRQLSDDPPVPVPVPMLCRCLVLVLDRAVPVLVFQASV